MLFIHERIKERCPSAEINNFLRIVVAQLQEIIAHRRIQHIQQELARRRIQPIQQEELISTDDTLPPLTPTSDDEIEEQN